MGKVTTSIDIDASPEDVWAVVTDLRRLGDWVTIHKDFPEPPPDEVSKGVTFEQTLELAGTAFDVEWTAKSVEESKRLEWEGKGPAGTKARTEYRLSEHDGGTRFDYENEFELPGGALGRIAGGAVDSRSEKEAEESLERLKALVE
ncbi:MAG: SRPBCC family protein [Thermoleophilaceae bacterium]